MNATEDLANLDQLDRWRIAAELEDALREYCEAYDQAEIVAEHYGHERLSEMRMLITMGKLLLISSRTRG